MQQDITNHAGQEGQQAQADLDALTVQGEQLEQKVQQMDRNRAALEDAVQGQHVHVDIEVDAHQP